MEMEELREQISLEIKEQLAEFQNKLFKNMLEKIVKDLKEELGFNSAQLEEECFEATLPSPQIEQTNQDLEECELIEADYDKILENRSEDLEVGVEQDAESEYVDTQTFKNKLLIKAQQERSEMTDLIIDLNQEDTDNFDQFKVFVFDIQILRKHKSMEILFWGKNYFKVLRKVSGEDTGNLKELMFLQGEEWNENVFEGLERGWTDLWKIIIGQILKYIIQFDTKD